MNKYILLEQNGVSYVASGKARRDVAHIMEMEGYTTVVVVNKIKNNNLFSKIIRQMCYCIQYIKIQFQIPSDSIVLTQNPWDQRYIFRRNFLKSLKKKNVKIIALIHDVEELRKTYEEPYYSNEFNDMITYSNVLISQNNKMKSYLVERNYMNPDKIVELGIFDYLTDTLYSKPKFSTTINIAGNLNSQKCGYIKELKKIAGVKFNLYGVGLSDNDIGENITYCGAFDPGVLPTKLNEGFGLVWDGKSILSCEGDTGNYLRYNNPHKLSLYISSGLPVVVWRDSAEAKLVIDNKLGFAVSSLTELEGILAKISEEDYYLIADSVAKFGEKLRTGYFTRSAIEKCEEIIFKK